MSDTSSTAPATRDNWALTPRRVLIGALCFDAFFMLTYIITQLLRVTPTTKPLIFLVDLNAEGNAAAWWQGSQLLLIALSFFALALWFFQGVEKVAPLRRLFFVAGLAFTYLSADEIGQVHENMSRVLQSWHAFGMFELRVLNAMGIHLKHSIRGGSVWIIVFAIVGLLLIWWLWPQIRLAWKLWRREIILLVVGFGVLVFAGTVIESLGDFIPRNAYSIRVIEVGIEESMESLGASIILFSAVSVLAAAGAAVLPGVAPKRDETSPAE
jgi:hypothetical protein